MAIPKIKLYRLNQNYDPNNDTDIQSISDDEMYPFVEKSLDLSLREQLTGVTYRDMMAGKSKQGFAEEATMLDTYKSELVDCDGWRLDNISVRLSSDGGSTWSDVVPERFYRLNFTEIPVLDSELSPTSKRQSSRVQVEFGKWIYSGSGIPATFIPNPSIPISKVRLEYCLFSDDLTTSLASSESLSLQRGHIYDGTFYGRAEETTSGNSKAIITDSDGIPLKSEGNLGYKIKIYPCRQLVAQLGTPSSDWVKDLAISDTGSITVTDCNSWILTQTDERKPRLFQRITVTRRNTLNVETTYSYYKELEPGTQYSSSLKSSPNGSKQIVFQLSADYYNENGSFIYPKELFIRYNEEEDVTDDFLIPRYTEIEQGVLSSGTWSKVDGTDLGDLSLASGRSVSSMGRREFKICLTEDNGYSSESSDNLLLSWNGSTFSISLAEGMYDGEHNLLKVYEDGECIYDKGSLPSSSKYHNASLTSSSLSMTLVDSDMSKPASLAISFFEEHSFSNGKISDGDGGYVNPWAVGWRICGWEKTQTASVFVSSFRNWVGDHLNNSPDIFEGYKEYDGSETNPVGISYISSGFSILYRDGAVSFTSPVSQITFNDIRNWPPSTLNMNYATTTLDEMKLYTNMVYAKFAYYDGIQDVSNGLLRKIGVSSNAFIFKQLEDPTYNTENSPNYAGDDVSGDGRAVEKTTATNKRWILRNDSKMPTMFFHDGEYLPTPSYANSKDAFLWTADSVMDGQFLQVNVSTYRTILVENAVSSPIVAGEIGNGARMVKYGNISWSPSYSDDTSLLPSPSAGSVIFPIRTLFEFNSSTGLWTKKNSWLESYSLTEDISVQPDKDYYLASGTTYVKVDEPTGNPKTSYYLEKSEIPCESKEIEDPTKSISYIFEHRERITYSTNAVCPYNLVFKTGENGLLVYAKIK